MTTPIEVLDYKDVVLSKESPFSSVAEYFLSRKDYGTSYNLKSFRKYFYPIIGSKPINSISLIEYLKCIKEIRSKLSVSYCDWLIWMLKYVLSNSYNYGLIEKDLSLKIKPYKKVLYKQFYYSIINLKIILNNIDKVDSCLILYIMLVTGANFNEILALKVKDYNPDLKTISINSRITTYYHKCLIKESLRLRKRTLYLNDYVCNKLNNYLINNDSEYIFIKDINNIDNYYNHYLGTIKKLRRLTGIKSFNFTRYRQTIIRYLLNLNINYIELSKILGYDYKYFNEKKYLIEVFNNEELYGK